MSGIFVEAGSPKQISASALIKTGGGSVVGIFCSNAGASSRVALSDGVASAASAGLGRVVAPFAPSAGTLHRCAVSFGTGLFVSLSGSGQNVTVIYQPAV